MNAAGTMDRLGCRQHAQLGILALAVAFLAGCETPSAHTLGRHESFREDLPVDPPRPHSHDEDDRAAGGRLFALYCGSCHNARPLGERPFSNYHVAITHMRDQAYLTGKEYRQIIQFLRRWDNVGPPTPPVEPSPKRFVYSQPIPELRDESPAAGSAPPPTGPSPFREAGPPGASPREQPAPGPPAPIE
jgi:hypothetical protein